MLERTYLGIDIGTHSIKLVEYERGLREGRFLHCVELPLPPKAGPEEVAAVLAPALAEHGFALDCAVCALPGTRITQRHLRLPLTGKQVGGAVRLELEESVPVPLDQMILTYEAASLRSGQTDVLAILAPRADIEQRLALARQCGFEPRYLEVEGAVLANLTGALGWDPAPRLLLDIGHRKTNMCLIAQGKPLLLRSIPVAAQQLSEALGEELNLDVEEALAQLHRRGVLKPGTGAPVTLRVGVLLDQLAREALRSLQSLVSDGASPEAPTEVVLVGGAAEFPGLPEFFGERLGLACRTLEVTEATPGAGPLAGPQAPRFAQAAALAVRGAGAARSSALDLRQDEFRYIPDLSALWPQVQWTALLLGLLLLLWPVSLAAQLWGASREATQYRAAIAELERRIFPDAPASANPMQGFDARYSETKQLAEHLGVTGTGASPLELLRRISASIPDSLEVSLSELRIERNSIRARGFAPNVAAANQVEQLLRQVEVFSNVTIGDIEREGGSAARPAGFSFNLTIELAR